MAHDVFISYATANLTVAQMVCATLEKQGIRCWMAPRDVQPGEDWGGAIVDAIKASRAMVLVFSGAANESHHIPREIERAIGREIPVVPVRIENVEPRGSLEYSLSSVHWLDAISPPVEAHIVKLADRLRTMLHRPVATGSAQVASPLETDPAAPSVIASNPHPDVMRPAPAGTKPPSRRGLIITGAVIAIAILVYALAHQPPAPAATPGPATSSPVSVPQPALPANAPESLHVDPSARWQASAAHSFVSKEIDSQRVASLRREADAHRNDPRPAIDLGDIFYDGGRFDLAVIWYLDVLERMPGNVSVRVDLAMSYWYMKRDVDALSHLHGVLDAEPLNPIALVNLGVIYAKQGKLDDAARDWRKVIEAQPGTWEAQQARELLNKIGAR